VLKSLEEELPADLQHLLEQFESCGSCQACMNVCPICSVDEPRKTKDGKLVREDMVNWLLSCAGCGMCEQACPQHQPLSAVFSHIREQIEAELTL
jgi:Fe-S oxidoreductase